MLNGMFWRLNSGLEVNRILRMRQRRVAVSFNSPGRPELDFDEMQRATRHEDDRGCHEDDEVEEP